MSLGRPSAGAGAARSHRQSLLAAVSGMVGAVFGLVTNLYSAEFRQAIESSGRGLTSTAVSFIVVAVAASASTSLVFWALSRRLKPAGVAAGEIKIRADALQSVPNVFGRRLHYLEVKRDSNDLVVFLHGLGLDAGDFRAYISESRFHCVALTLFGFNVSEKDDPNYPPLPLDSHVQLLGYALRKLKTMYPRKRMSLVGFSFGADMILFLGARQAEVVRGLGIRRAVLLDPNVNSSTTIISGHIARAGEEHSVDQFVEILGSAKDVAEFRYLSEYLYKITAKDFQQIRQHAREVVAVWSDESTTKFLDHVGQLMRLVEGVHVVLSGNAETLFNAVAASAAARGLDADTLDYARCDHFELIEPAMLKNRLEGVL